jgi:hypothetical protein
MESVCYKPEILGERFDFMTCPSRKSHPDFGCLHRDKDDFRFIGQLPVNIGGLVSRGILASSGRNKSPIESSKKFKI